MADSLTISVLHLNKCMHLCRHSPQSTERYFILFYGVSKRKLLQRKLLNYFQDRDRCEYFLVRMVDYFRPKARGQCWLLCRDRPGLNIVHLNCKYLFDILC